MKKKHRIDFIGKIKPNYEEEVEVCYLKSITASLMIDGTIQIFYVDDKRGYSFESFSSEKAVLNFLKLKKLMLNLENVDFTIISKP